MGRQPQAGGGDLLEALQREFLDQDGNPDWVAAKGKWLWYKRTSPRPETWNDGPGGTIHRMEPKDFAIDFERWCDTVHRAAKTILLRVEEMQETPGEAGRRCGLTGWQAQNILVELESQFSGTCPPLDKAQKRH